MPLREGWRLAFQVLPIGTIRERSMNPPGSDLYRGHQPLSSPM
jgi:hypothetical protein